MLYVKRLASGIARISYDDTEDYDFIFSEIPDYQNGILMITETGELYLDGDIPDIDEPTDHEVLNALLGVTE